MASARQIATFLGVGTCDGHLPRSRDHSGDLLQLEEEIVVGSRGAACGDVSRSIAMQLVVASQ